MEQEKSFIDLPEHIQQRIFTLASAGDERTLFSIATTRRRFRDLMVGPDSYHASLCEAYIRRHANLSQYAKSHLRSKMTHRALRLELGTVEQFAAMGDIERIREAVNATPFLFCTTAIIQQNLDNFTHWRIKNRASVTIDGSLSGLVGFPNIDITLKVFAAFMGLTAAQTARSFTWLHLAAICKGIEFAKIENKSELAVYALTLNEDLADVEDQRTTDVHLSFSAYGIKLRTTLPIPLQILTSVLSIFTYKIKNHIYNAQDIKKLNLVENFTTLHARAVSYDNFVESDEVVQLKVVAGLPNEQIEDTTFSMHAASVYSIGYSVSEIRKYADIELFAISVGLSPQEAIKYKFNNVQLNYFKDDFNNNTHQTKSPLDSEYFNKLKDLNTYQSIIFGNYNGDDLVSYNITLGHVIYTKLHDTGEYYSREELLQPGILLAGRMLGLTENQIYQPWFSEMHEIFIYSSIEIDDNFEDEDAAIAARAQLSVPLYNQYAGLNAFQVLACVQLEMSREDVQRELLPYALLEALEETEDEELKNAYRSLSEFQLDGLTDLDLTLEQAQKPWYRPYHNTILEIFNKLFSFDDLDPANLQNLLHTHDVPISLLQNKDASWAHVLAFVRGISISDLKNVNEAQALGLAIGLTLEQLQDGWFQPEFVEYLLPNPDGSEFDLTFPYNSIIGLNLMQLSGLTDGLSRDDVESDWYGCYHMCALDLGYNLEFVRGASEQAIVAIINDSYTCEIDQETLDRFIEHHYAHMMLSQDELNARAFARLPFAV